MAGKDPAAILQKIKSNDQWGVARSLIIIQDASTNDPSSDEISNMIGCITTDRGTLNTRIKSHESELKNVQSDSDKNDENIIKLKNHYKKLGQELRELEESIRKLKVRYRELNEEKNYCESDEFDLYEYYAELSRYCANLAWCLKVQYNVCHTPDLAGIMQQLESKSQWMLARAIEMIPATVDAQPTEKTSEVIADLLFKIKNVESQIKSYTANDQYFQGRIDPCTKETEALEERRRELDQEFRNIEKSRRELDDHRRELVDKKTKLTDELHALTIESSKVTERLIYWQNIRNETSQSETEKKYMRAVIDSLSRDHQPK